ncbi:MAG: acetyl-CoA carboxylase biotin carboxyl carrier protein [Lachnospiraceae bacterium]|nr:acetyl-CoA carboxylase biotin carboxyl carrier protein [Lachnospiraceae bacterium]
MSMEYRNILELWERFETSCVTEMSLDFQGTHFSLKKGAYSEAQLYDFEDQSSVGVKSAKSVNDDRAFRESGEQSSGISEETKHSSEAVNEPVKEIRAPLVGTFYRAPAPDAAPFVEVGQTVKKGDVVGIIEAMKLMNEIIAEEEGVVAEIPAQDAALVGYDDLLIRLR